MAAHRADFCPHHADPFCLEFLAERLERPDRIGFDHQPLVCEVDVDLVHLFFYPRFRLLTVPHDDKERGTRDDAVKVRGCHLDPGCCGD